MDDRTEHLISRRIDGELQGDEALELDKHLIRSPDSRRLLEDYEADDRLAREVLRSAFSSHPARTEESIAPVTSHHWLSRVGLGVRAVAAAILLITMVGVPTWWSRNASPVPTIGSGPAIAALQPETVADLIDAPRVEGPREERRRLNRDVVAVWDEETQSYYILEMDHRAETVVPVAMNY